MKYHTRIIDGQPVVTVREVVHRFLVNDYFIDTVESSIDEHLRTWANSEPGQWILANTIGQPEIRKEQLFAMMSVGVAVIAELSEANLTFYNLKWS